MKIPFPLTTMLICILQLQASAQEITYFNAGWKITSSDSAAYFRKKQKVDSGWQVTDCFISGKTQMTGFYLDDSCHIQQGEFVWYDEKGNLYHRCRYERGKEEGKDILYYDNSRTRTEGENKAGKRTGEWMGYYPSGKLSARVRYKEGKQTSATFFNEDGSVNDTQTQFSREAKFPGGMEAYIQFLNSTFKYPRSAIKKNIQGTVIVGFHISKDGSITDIKVVTPVEKSLDEEALRVIKHMPHWEPLIIGGVACDCYQKQPIDFKLVD